MALTSAAVPLRLGTVPAVIVHDFFPARVRLPDGRRLSGARVAVDGDMRAVVLSGTRSSGVTVEARALLASTERASGTRTWTLLTAEGKTWEVVPGGGCGCGSPLRRHNAEASIIAEFGAVPA